MPRGTVYTEAEVAVMFWWILMAIAGVTLVELALSTIERWFDAHTLDESSYGELIRERLDSGDYKVISGVFDERGTQTASETWVAQNLDDDIQDLFGPHDCIRVEL